MSWWGWFLIGLGVVVAVWAAFVFWLVAVGRRKDARALATFIPDCVVLVTRLARDPRVPRRRKFLLLGLAGYLALPFDLVPDFIPVAGTARRRDHRRARSSPLRPCRRRAADPRTLARSRQVARSRLAAGATG
jgi:hypothetical protein